ASSGRFRYVSLPAPHFSAMCLDERPVRGAGNVVELAPVPVQLLLALLVEDQIVERDVVAEISHLVQEASTEETARIEVVAIGHHVREAGAAFGEVEHVGEDR